jgi:hypothetical protein
MYERQWAVFMGLVAAVVTVANEALEIVSTQVEAGGTKFNWLTLLFIAQAFATRWNVWSANTVGKIAATGGGVAVGD